MNINEIQELHYITPLKNIPSIFSEGILSHDRAEGVKKDDISLEGVQQIRAQKIVPNGLDKTIHEHAVLYFNARNPMLYLRKSKHEEICVLRVKPTVLSLKNATISDMNASVKLANFQSVTEGLKSLRKDILTGKFWTSKYNDKDQNKLNGQYRCAEVLVPERIHPSHIGGVYVSCEKVKNLFLQIFNNNSPVPICINPEFFFQNGPQLTHLPPLSNAKYPEIQGYEKKVTMMNHFQPVQKKQKTASTATFNYVTGDLLKSKRQTLVNTVNCQGAMGAGIALQFKDRHPEMFEDYVKRCKAGQVKPGIPYLFTTKKGVRILNFPTKDHWKNSSQMQWVVNGLKFIAEHSKDLGIESLALPPLGCGHGKLNWSIVRPTIEKHLSQLPIEIDIYSPK